MLIPHLHFCGNCKEAISLYEKAFHTKLETISYTPDGKKVDHAAMIIQGQKVFLNDNFGNRENSLDCGVHLILTFGTVEEAKACYETLKVGGHDVGTFSETPYSKWCGNFMDRFGILWGFMADA